MVKAVTTIAHHPSRSSDYRLWAFGLAAAGGIAIAWQLAQANGDLGPAALIFGSILLAATISSTVGFAFSAIAGATLLHLLPHPLDAVKVMMIASIVIQAYSVHSLRHEIDLRALAPFLAGGILTLPLGVYLLLHISPYSFQAVLGTLLALYGAYMLVRFRPPTVAGSWLGDFVAGAAGGITGGLAAFPGAFVTIWCGMRGGDKTRQRALYQPYILLMQLLAVAVLGSAGAWDSSDLALLGYAPAALLGAYAGLQLFRRMTDHQFSVALYLLLIVSGAALVAP